MKLRGAPLKHHAIVEPNLTYLRAVDHAHTHARGNRQLGIGFGGGNTAFVAAAAAPGASLPPSQLALKARLYFSLSVSQCGRSLPSKRLEVGEPRADGTFRAAATVIALVIICSHFYTFTLVSGETANTGVRDEEYDVCRSGNGFPEKM